jgi:acetolactate synthase-1/2/3 large subunit
VDRLNALLNAADLVLVLGARLSSASTYDFALAIPQDRLVQVDASEEILGATYPARLTIPGTVEDVLERLLAGLESDGPPASQWTVDAVRKRRRDLLATGDRAIPDPTVSGVDPPTMAEFFAALRRRLPRDAIVVADSGLHQLLARRHLDVLAPRGLLVPSDFQSMGFALPAAIGAHLAAPERPVVVLVGDGGLALSGMELLTAVQERVPLTVVVFNDGWLNLIRMTQLRTLGQTFGVRRTNPDFGTFADALGARFALVEDNLDQILGEALASPEVTLVELRVGDSGTMRTARARGLARRAAASALGPGAFARLKRWLGRR